MTLVDALLPEFDREMGVTRRVLDRVPDTELEWRPHEKSMSIGRLAEHLTELAGWSSAVLKETSLDAAGSKTEGQEAPVTRDALVALFDRRVQEARAALVGRTDAELMVPWTFTFQGKEVFTLPRVAALRSFIMNHLIHHRGQLSVYLRLRNVPVPSIYGPSADEQA